jgi:WD40 repeat protein
VAFGPDSTTLYSVGYDRHLRIWNVADGKETKNIGPAPHDLLGLAISRDGKQVATAGIGGSIRVYDAASGKETFTKQFDNLITYSVTFTPDGKHLVIGNAKDNAARVVAIK